MYVPAIDGLRAVAVSGVILYHLGAQFCLGGYLGVDVFFVVSGYLISAILFRDIDRDNFRFSRFYERRIRRIAPALAVMLIAATGAAIALQLPSELMRYGQSLLATILWGSNLHFWLSTNYFANTEPMPPLLHTWSLGVEEQFYIAFPFAAILLSRERQTWRVPILLLALAVSLGSAIWLQTRTPAAVFYLPVTRGWELLSGVCLAALGQRARCPSALATPLAIAGLLTIIGSFAFMRSTMSFPIGASLVATIGTAALLFSCQSYETIASRTLAQPMFTWIGLRSYSLYLWHWPITAFFRIATDRVPTLTERGMLLALTFVCASTSYRFIERPARSCNLYLPKSTNALKLLGTCVVLLLCAIALIFTQGLAWRQPPVVNHFLAAEQAWQDSSLKCVTQGRALLSRNTPCHFGPESENPHMIVWGDSHAGSLMPMLMRLADSTRTPGVMLSTSGCPPLLDVWRDRDTGLCHSFGREVRRYLLSKAPTDVIIVGYWSLYVIGQESDATSASLLVDSTGLRAKRSALDVLRDGVNRTVSELTARGVRIWIVEQIPSQPRRVPLWLATVASRRAPHNQLGRLLDDHRARQSAIKAIFATAAAISAGNVILIQPTTALCADGICHAARGTESLYIDANHLTPIGAMQLRPLFEPVFASAPMMSTRNSRR